MVKKMANKNQCTVWPELIENCPEKAKKLRRKKIIQISEIFTPKYKFTQCI